MSSFRIGLLGATAIALVGAGLYPGVAAANPITILNPSFENPAQGSGDYTGSVTDWTTNNSGVLYPPSSDFTPGSDGLSGSRSVPDGNQVMYMQGSSNTYAYQFLTTPIAVGTYTLSVYLGQRESISSFAPVYVDLFYGGTSANVVVDNTYTTTGGAGQWVEETLTYTVLPGFAGLTACSGGPCELGIDFQTTTGTASQAAIDDVTLNYSVSAVPLPAALPLFAGGLSLFGGVGYWRKRRQDKSTALVAA